MQEIRGDSRTLTVGLAGIGRFGKRHASPVASLDDAAEGLRVAEAIVASAETGREVTL